MTSPSIDFTSLMVQPTAKLKPRVEALKNKKKYAQLTKTNNTSKRSQKS